MSQGDVQSLRDELREQGRAITGGLLVVGVTYLYTMETWWLGWTLPTWHLLVYDVVGLGGVLAITRGVGFRQNGRGEGSAWNGPIRQTLFDFAELVFQSFVTAYVVLLLFGVIDLDEPLVNVARLGLIEVVPLGFGAALANELLTGDGNGGGLRRSFPESLATFTLGAVFLSSTMAPTEEMERIAAHAGWVRITLLVPVTVALTYLMLYELELEGQSSRRRVGGGLMQVGQAFLVYALSFVVAAGLLAAFGHFSGTTLAAGVEMTVVLALPASVGATAAEVII